MKEKIERIWSKFHETNKTFLGQGPVDSSAAVIHFKGDVVLDDEKNSPDSILVEEAGVGHWNWEQSSQLREDYEKNYCWVFGCGNKGR